MIEPVIEERCDGCGLCMIYCAHEILQFDRLRRKVFLVHPEECDCCYRCVRHCPQGALRVVQTLQTSYPIEPVGGTFPVTETTIQDKSGSMPDMPERTDIIVIGAGAAGLVAAISARENGASVLVMDKAPNIHETNTSRSGGNIRPHPEVRLDPGGRELTVEEKVNRAQALTGGRVVPELIRVFAQNIDDDIQWLTHLGMRWKERPQNLRGLAVITAQGDGPGLNKQLLSMAQRAGATVIFSIKVLGLLTDSYGVVTGINAMTPKGPRRINASAVVLATGGFQANQEMLIRYMGASFAHATRLVGSPFSTGDGHRMAQAVNAKLVHMDQFHCSLADRNRIPGTAGGSRVYQLNPLTSYGILVNRLGRRFVDEGVEGDSVACSILAQPGGEAALIMDEGIRAMDSGKVDGYMPPGTLVKVGSLQELSRVIGCPYGELQKTLAEFNASVRDGTAIGLDVPKAKWAFKLETPPYYCVHPVWATLNCSLGGPQITARAQVLSLENTPIAGLYATGEMVGGFYFGMNYLTDGGAIYYKGNYLQTTASLATCLVFGRIAGKEAALAARATRRPDKQIIQSS